MLKKLNLSAKGESDLRRAIFACTVTNITLFFPYIILMQIMQHVIAPLTSAQPLDTGRLWQLLSFRGGSLRLVLQY